jgi:hypothetical protein
MLNSIWRPRNRDRTRKDMRTEGRKDREERKPIVLQAAAFVVVGTRIENGESHCQFLTTSRSSRPSVPRYWSASKAIASPKPSSKRIVHGRNGRTRKRKAGQTRQGLAARRAAPPCRPPASLPCFPFVPWSNRLPSGVPLRSQTWFLVFDGPSPLRGAGRWIPALSPFPSRMAVDDKLLGAGLQELTVTRLESRARLAAMTCVGGA